MEERITLFHGLQLLRGLNQLIGLKGGTAINNLDVYPNPSRDIYNITFTSENVQDIRIRY